MWCSKVDLRCLLMMKFDKSKLFSGEVPENHLLCLKSAYIIMHSELGGVGKLDKWSISDKLKKDLLGMIHELRGIVSIEIIRNYFDLAQFSFLDDDAGCQITLLNSFRKGDI